MMLHAITLESLRAAVVHVHWQRDRHGALRETLAVHGRF